MIETYIKENRSLYKNFSPTFLKNYYKLCLNQIISYTKKTINESIENNDFKKNICINYLEGLEWVCNYYQGKEISWIWKYNYSYPPLLNDLKLYIPHFDTQFLEKNDYCFSSLLQLVYVLPQSQYHLLPDKVVNYVKSNYKCLTNSNFPIKWAFCRYFWESHIEFDTIPIDMLIKLDGELLVL